jgi:hypothetical protein
MCDAVEPAGEGGVVDSRSLNNTWTRIVFATVSMVTNAEPVPGDMFGGDSLGPLRVAK